jgi:branched-chain amino acid transport system substrate-binding protein
MFKKSIFTQLLTGFITFVLVVACSQNNKPSTTTNNSPGTTSAATSIPIGIAVAQTSNVALLGQEEVIGAKIAEQYFNQKGGVNGTPIKLVFQDTAGDEQGAINAFNTLITQDKVVGIVGPTLSQQAFSADPIAERAKVPVLGLLILPKVFPRLGNILLVFQHLWQFLLRTPSKKQSRSILN